MNPEDRRLIVAIGQAARTCAMYRELLEVARRYQQPPEVERLTHSLASADSELARLIAQALDDTPPAAGPDAEPGVDGDGDGEPTTEDD